MKIILPDRPTISRDGDPFVILRDDDDGYRVLAIVYGRTEQECMERAVEVSISIINEPVEET